MNLDAGLHSDVLDALRRLETSGHLSSAESDVVVCVREYVCDLFVECGRLEMVADVLATVSQTNEMGPGDWLKWAAGQVSCRPNPREWKRVV